MTHNANLGRAMTAREVGRRMARERAQQRAIKELARAIRDDSDAWDAIEREAAEFYDSRDGVRGIVDIDNGPDADE